MHISAALPQPTILGRKKLELRSAPPVPMLMYWAQKNASSLARRTSEARAKERPAPIAGPCTAAITGCRQNTMER